MDKFFLILGRHKYKEFLKNNIRMDYF